MTNNGTPSCPGNVACVFVGQKIALTTDIDPPLPPGVTVQSYSWSMPQGTVVGGYAPSTASAEVQPFPHAQAGPCQRNLAESCLTFYSVDPGSSRTLTFSYTLTTGQQGSAAVTFSVGGPTNVGIAVTPTPLNPVAIQIGQGNTLGHNGLVVYFGSNVIGGQPGITLNASSILPSGNQGEYSWIQLLTKYNYYSINAQGRWRCPLDESPELDGAYNYLYQTGATKVDTPGVPADPDKGEVAVTFEATSYLMWMPIPAAGCTGVACAVLVPLAKLGWSWTGNAINTLASQPNGTTWMLMGCQTCSNGPAQMTNSHPQWQRSTLGGCLPSLIQ